MLNYLKKHSPAIIGIALVIIDSLAQAGYINPSPKEGALINGILTVMGLGVIHFRQVSASKPPVPALPAEGVITLAGK